MKCFFSMPYPRKSVIDKISSEGTIEDIAEYFERAYLSYEQIKQLFYEINAKVPNARIFCTRGIFGYYTQDENYDEALTATCTLLEALGMKSKFQPREMEYFDTESKKSNLIIVGNEIDYRDVYKISMVAEDEDQGGDNNQSGGD